MDANTVGLDPAKALAYAANLPQLPEGAESWFAIPRWEKVGQTYGEAVDAVQVSGRPASATNARTAHARATSLREPSGSSGNRACKRSRKRAMTPTTKRWNGATSARIRSSALTVKACSKRPAAIKGCSCLRTACRRRAG